MSQYKTELHAHTSPVSHCAVATVEELLDCYKKAGYHTVVLTNHMSHYTFHDQKVTNWKAAVDYYLSDYRKLVSLAGDEMNILLGMELCFDGDGITDYLVYGITEEFLYSAGNLMEMTIDQFSKIARQEGFLLIQAHPFRNMMRVTNPAWLDGVEVQNGNPRWDSNDEIAKLWAKRFDLLTTSGSDFHLVGDEGNGGIVTDQPITNNAKLLQTIRSGEMALLGRK